MAGQGYEELIILNRKIDELLGRYNNLKCEIEELKTGNRKLESMLLEKEEKLKELEIKHERTRISGALSGEGENAITARKKITELVREIDRCVALLNR